MTKFSLEELKCSKLSDGKKEEIFNEYKDALQIN